MTMLNIYVAISKYPKVDNDLLILAASFKRSPSAPEVFCLLYMLMITLLVYMHLHHSVPKIHLVQSTP